MYQVIKKDNILPVDIDGTLIAYVDPKESDFHLNYGDEPQFLKLMSNNIALLKHHKTVRDYYIVIWSANGKEWAEEVVKALGLEEYVDLIMTKPCKYVDDNDVSNWMPSRIFLDE